ncbi:MAG TPA: hypothetical protein VIQ80_02260 [Candidatus Saccharimonadales bacterium]
MARVNRGGSVLGFIVTAIIMAALLIGSAYTLRQITTRPTMAQQEAPQENKNNPPVAANNNGNQNPADTGAKNPDDTSVSSGNNTPQQPASGATQLPHTGPVSLTGSILAVGLLSLTAVAYARSRRPELSL